MNARWLMPVLVAVCSACLVGLLGMLASSRRARLAARLREMKVGDAPGGQAPVAAARLAGSALPTLGNALLPTDEKERTALQSRLIQAGCYGRQAMVAFLGVKLLLMIGPALVGLALGLAKVVPVRQAVLYGACAGAIGMIGPSFWLDKKKKARQTAFRRGIPDALDVVVICVEGGLSLIGAIRRVAGDLEAVHPSLAAELQLVQREVQLGQTVGDALKRFGDRVDMEEIRCLASIVIQSERFGAGLAKALRVHAETVRQRRQQRAEEMAQKAGTKVLFPTLLFIFPAIFVVILGPAMLQIGATMSSMGK